MVYNRRPEFAKEQEAAIKQLCEGLRAFRECGYEWSEVRTRVLHWATLMEGEEADEAKQKAVAGAAEKSYCESRKKRRLAKKPKRA